MPVCYTPRPEGPGLSSPVEPTPDETPELRVALDRDLLNGTLALEAFWQALRKDWRTLRHAPAAFSGAPGAAATIISEIDEPQVETLPYDRDALDRVRSARKAGQRVVMFYRSANFDEEVFDDPHTFNILRDPNPHVGFGGTGVHYCIGANLARMTITLMFNAIADNMPDLAPLGDPERLRSGWLNGIKHWQVDYTGSSAS